MMLAFITGDPGAGKTACHDILQERGYTSFDIDRDGLASPINIDTGEITDTIGDTAEWHNRHDWGLNPEKIDEIKIATDDEIAFVCGTVTDDSRLWHTFDKHFALYADEATILHRLITRPNNPFGKSPAERELVIENRPRRRELYQKLGAIPIDATQPKEAMVDEILSRLT